MRIPVPCVAVAVLVAGCGGGDASADPDPSQSPTPDTVHVAVTLIDQAPQDVLLNYDNNECTTVFLGQKIPVTVTVRDADGSIVATTDVPDTGGEFTNPARGLRGNCRWTIRFE